MSKSEGRLIPDREASCEMHSCSVPLSSDTTSKSCNTAFATVLSHELRGRKGWRKAGSEGGRERAW